MVLGIDHRVTAQDGDTHELAQRLAPESRVVYGPTVLAHAAALLTSSPEGRTSYLDEDLRNADTILAQAGKLLDLNRPVALVLLGAVMFVEDDEEARGIVRRLPAALPMGSHLVLSHTITRPDLPDVDAAVAFWNEHGTPRLTQRPPGIVAGLFEGLQLLGPGVVSCNRWHPAPAPGGAPAGEVAMFGGAGRKQ
ncbi:hypothetical protein GCM10027162_07650 [Streptomyces incanus]